MRNARIVSAELYGVTVTITASEAPDDAPVVFVDTTDELDGPMGPEIRIRLNDEPVYIGKDYQGS
jgi:hypothetical protein